MNMNFINNNEIHLNKKKSIINAVSSNIFAMLKRLLILFLLWFRNPLYVIRKILTILSSLGVMTGLFIGFIAEDGFDAPLIHLIILSFFIGFVPFITVSFYDFLLVRLLRNRNIQSR
ncbi:hypothetical protein ME3_01309 [Bartonella melophagi K-2C]|uniref:Uncharacterized protein n=1 Tax=Bartonella melophagi K-2C TaxID=1094557 RepID=J1JT33_9HYPH|nr:hypothetical protein ME3_01309 [Bartonella melophagi K-2C]